MKEVAIVKELTPELADKIWKAFEKKRYDERVSKDAVLHHLKQLKAQMGKRYKEYRMNEPAQIAVKGCMSMVDNKIAKIKLQ